MARKTIYTSTISVPVYTSWKCPKCGKVNFSTGIIVCARQESSGSFRMSKQIESKNRARDSVKQAWIKNALNIIFEPQKHAQDLRSDLLIKSTNCTACKKKPKWDKGMSYLKVLNIAIVSAGISGIIAFITLSNLVAWAAFALSIAAIAFCFISERMYKKTMAEMPKDLLPVIGSLNEELQMAAMELGVSMPTPDETVKIASGLYLETNKKNSFIIPEEKNENSYKPANYDIEDNQNRFCRKCGTPLHEDSAFCHKCGTSILK